MATDLQVKWRQGKLERDLEENKNIRGILHISEPIRRNLMLSGDTELSAYFVNWDRNLERRDFDFKNFKEIRSEIIVDHPWTSLGEYFLVNSLAIATGGYAINSSNEGSVAAYMLLLFAGFGVFDMGSGKWKKYKNDLEAWNKYQKRKGEF